METIDLPRYSDSLRNGAYRERTERAFGIVFTHEPVESWREWRGHDIHFDDWAPAGERRGTVILVHGAGGNGRVLAPFILPAVQAGFAVRAADLPGYGLSRVKRGARVDYAEWVELSADLAMEAAERGPVFLYGMSVGGITALWAAQRAGAVAGVIATTLLDLRDPATFVRATRAPWLGKASLAAFRLAPWLIDPVALPLALIEPLEKLTTDDELARLLCEDPLIGRRRIPARFFRSMTTYRPPREDFALPCPLLFVHPGADEWTPSEMSMPVFNRVPTDKELVVLSNGSHAPLEQPAYAELGDALRRFLDRV